MTSEFKLGIKEWAELNSERYRASEFDSSVIGFEWKGFFITNPFLDCSGVEAVNPKAMYGERYEQWLSTYQREVTARAHSKNSNS